MFEPNMVNVLAQTHEGYEHYFLQFQVISLDSEKVKDEDTQTTQISSIQLADRNGKGINLTVESAPVTGLLQIHSYTPMSNLEFASTRSYQRLLIQQSKLKGKIWCLNYYHFYC